jgi:hypothetical protein
LRRQKPLTESTEHGKTQSAPPNVSANDADAASGTMTEHDWYEAGYALDAQTCSRCGVTVSNTERARTRYSGRSVCHGR